MHRVGRELFVCHSSPTACELRGPRVAPAHASRRPRGDATGTFRVRAAAEAGRPRRSPALFDAYAKQVAFDAWEPDASTRARLRDSLPVDWENGTACDDRAGISKTDDVRLG